MMKKALILFIPFYLSMSVTGLAGQPDKKLIVYYFHRTVRCPSCLLLEDLTRHAVRSGFGPQIKTGQIELKVINIDKPDNSSFEKHYHLQFQSVVLSEVVNGDEIRWKNLASIWDYLHEEDKFFDYIQKEIHLFHEE